LYWNWNIFEAANLGFIEKLKRSTPAEFLVPAGLRGNFMSCFDANASGFSGSATSPSQ